MRIADKMQYNQVQKNISQNRTDMANLQNQAATQKRINKPSDDPLASARVLGSRTEERGNNQFLKNINQAKAFLEFADQSLGELGEILVRAKELAINQSNDASANAESRLVTASEVGQIFNQSIQIGNRKLGERFIFGGFKTQTKPFTEAGDYMGDNGEMKIQTHKESFMAMNLPGNKVFHGIGLSGDGTARPEINTPMDVEELNQWRAEKDKIKQEQEMRQEDFIQTRGPSSLEKRSRLSYEDPVDKGAGINVFQVLRDLEVALKTNDKQGIFTSLDDLDASIAQVVLARSEVGSRIMSVNGTTESLQKAVVDNRIAASQLEDVDVFNVVSEINKTDAALKATLETSGRMIQPSLMDFVK